MIRTVFFCHRRDGLTREAFRDHYERRHAPLGARHLAGLEFYVRNHVREERGAHVMRGQELEFDVITEFEYASQRAFDDALATLATPIGEEIREDEARFMRRETNSYFASRREASYGDRPAAGAMPKTIALLRSERSEGGALRASLAERVREAAIRLGRAGARAAELDVAIDGDPMGAPAWDVLLHVWWEPELPVGRALDGVEAELDGALFLAVAVEECGSVAFDYATEYPERCAG